MKFFYSRWTW